MLTLIGMGLWDEKSISIEGLEALRVCDAVLAEQYTNRMSAGTLPGLERMCGKSIALLSRADVEDGKKIIDAAKELRVALLVPGDPMVATTHVSLLLAARKAGIETRTVHGSSILSAACECGLQAYKFGAVCTLSFWSKNYVPLSAYDAIARNKRIGLHSLVLLDIAERPMHVHEALELLLKMEAERKQVLFSPDTRLVVLAALGSGGAKITYGSIAGLQKRELGPFPHALVVPGSLHFMEKEALALHEI
jgi:diphthine synthase